MDLIAGVRIGRKLAGTAGHASVHCEMTLLFSCHRTQSDKKWQRRRGSRRETEASEKKTCTRLVQVSLGQQDVTE